MPDKLRIGGAVGFWGEAPDATRVLIENGDVDVIIYDYLAEITMSIMARARSKDENAGFATDFVTAVLAPNLKEIADKGIRIISNAGGMNPKACAHHIEELSKQLGLNLRIAVIEGDDLINRVDDFAKVQEFETGAPLPDADSILSINAYLGAKPIARALELGADIVITGRCVDSALTLGAALWAFDWENDAFDKYATASLAGHLIECGPQASGGNFTDWDQIEELGTVGYPIAELSADGRLFIDKPVKTGGAVTPATVGEQLLYEIGDPTSYALPDVICDFSNVSLTQVAENRVEVIGTRGRAPSGQLKVSLTHATGFRAGYTLMFNGINARAKALKFQDMVFERAKQRLKHKGEPPFLEEHFEFFGGASDVTQQEEITLTLAVRHQSPKGVTIFLKDVIGAALAAPPGLHFFTGAGRPKPSPVVALYSFMIDTKDVPVSITLEDEIEVMHPSSAAHSKASEQPCVMAPSAIQTDNTDLVSVPLHRLAWARSGDKGNIANIGVMVRWADAMPYIWMALTPDYIRQVFDAEVRGEIMRYALPKLPAMNIVMKEALGGGGVASLRADSQGKGFAQRLLSQNIQIPSELWMQLNRTEL